MFFCTGMFIKGGNVHVHVQQISKLKLYVRKKSEHTSDSQYVKSWQFLATKSVTVPLMSVPFMAP